MKKKCIIFTRVSTEGQDLTQQHEVLINEAHRLNYLDEDILFIESKESAISKNIEEREGITLLLQQLDEADTVLVWEISRLARRADVMYKLRDIFISKQVQLICLTPSFKLLDENGKMSPTASLVLSLFTSLAESEMMIKKERMKRGMRQKINEGYYHGGEPFYGYMPDKDKRMIPNPQTAPIIQMIFNLYSTGEWTYRALGIHLKDAKLFPQISNSSCLSKVHDILSDSRYAGSSKTYPAIVSMSLYERCQEINLTHKKHIRTSNKHEMLLKGLLRSKKTNLVLGCIPSNRMYQSRTDDKPMMYIPQSKVDLPVYELAVTLHKKYINDKQLRQQRLLEELKIIDKKFRTASEEVKQCQDKLDRLEERIIIGNISHEKSTELSNRLNKELQEAINRKNEYNNLAVQKGQQMYDDYWDENTGAYDNLSYFEKRNILLQVIDKIVVERSLEDSRFILLEIHSKFHTINHLRIQTRKYFKRKV